MEKRSKELKEEKRGEKSRYRKDCKEQNFNFKIVTTVLLGLLQAIKIKINHNVSVSTPNQIINHKRCMAIIQMSSY